MQKFLQMYWMRTFAATRYQTLADKFFDLVCRWGHRRTTLQKIWG